MGTMDCGLWTMDYGLWTMDCGTFYTLFLKNLLDCTSPTAWLSPRRVRVDLGSTLVFDPPPLGGDRGTWHEIPL